MQPLTHQTEGRNFDLSRVAIDRHPSSRLQVTWSLLQASRSQGTARSTRKTGTAG